jgi:hypothetical protein
LRLDGKMRLFRDHIGQGAWLALIALVINLGLSFGHVHAIDAKSSEQGLLSLLAAAKSADGQTQGHPSDQADYLCPICTAAASLASPLASAPPLLPVEFAAISIDRPIAAVFAIDRPPTAAFQSRGPPLS